MLVLILEMATFNSCQQPKTRSAQRLPNIPTNAFWRGGSDGGNWYEILKAVSDSEFQIRIYNDQTGEIEIDSTFILSSGCPPKKIDTAELSRCIMGFDGEKILLALNGNLICSLVITHSIASNTQILQNPDPRHIKVIKDRFEAIPTIDEQTFCVSLRTIWEQDSLKKTILPETFYYLRFEFSVNKTNNITNVKFDGALPQFKNEIRLTKNLLKTSKWLANGRRLIAYVTFDLTPQGLADIEIVSENNYNRKSICINK